MSDSASPTLFPAFQRFVERNALLANAKGILAARLPRILGRGQTRAEGLDMPPAVIERQQELLALSLPDTAAPDPEVQREIAEAKRAVDAHTAHMRHADNRRRFAMEVLSRLEGIQTGNKDNQFFAGRLVLVPDKSGLNWAWSMTAYYPVIAKIPADIDYVVRAYNAADRIVEEWTLPVDLFLDRLRLAWTMARHFTSGDDVLIADVARLFKIAAQDERFWSTPARRSFEDVPEAAFIANLINWRRNRDAATSREDFELVPATLNQAHGPKSRAFFVPGNTEGTTVRPMIYMRRQSA
jgi:glycosyltransferase involved in cell wall biosynthesis